MKLRYLVDPNNTAREGYVLISQMSKVSKNLVTIVYMRGQYYKYRGADYVCTTYRIADLGLDKDLNQTLKKRLFLILEEYHRLPLLKIRECVNLGYAIQESPNIFTFKNETALRNCEVHSTEGLPNVH